MLKKIREFNEANKTIFFFILCFFLVSFLTINFILNRDKKEECVSPDFEVSSSKIYEYGMKITKPDEVVIVSAKRYGDKILIAKTEKGIEYDYYIYYYNIYQKDIIDNVFKPITNTNIVTGIDNNLFSLNYLEEICSGVKSKTEEDNICYNVEDMGIKVCANGDDRSLTLTKADLEIYYTFSNAGGVKDFSVNISE